MSGFAAVVETQYSASQRLPSEPEDARESLDIDFVVLIQENQWRVPITYKRGEAARRVNKQAVPGIRPEIPKSSEKTALCLYDMISKCKTTL